MNIKTIISVSIEAIAFTMYCFGLITIGDCCILYAIAVSISLQDYNNEK